jgi:tRNA-dihydrouridine synthase
VAPKLDWTDRHCRFFLRLITQHTRLYTEMMMAGVLTHGDVPRHLDFDSAGFLAARAGSLSAGTEHGLLRTAVVKQTVEMVRERLFVQRHRRRVGGRDRRLELLEESARIARDQCIGRRLERWREGDFWKD